MKKIIFNIVLMIAAATAATSCFNLEEQVYDRVDASIYYQNEDNVKGAVAAAYAAGIRSLEYFYQLQEFSADQVAWRSWNGGSWGYDEGEKTVLSTHTWTSGSVIIRSAWENSWTTIGLSNNIIDALTRLSPEELDMTTESMAAYVAELRTIRAWVYYNLFELWGGVLPLFSTVGTDVPSSASTDFDEGCRLIFDFIAQELDESLPLLRVNEVNRMNQAANRLLKARLLLNSEVFTGQDRYAECATLCESILDGDFGTYSIAEDYREIFSLNNTSCPEVILAFAFAVRTTEYGGILNQRDLPYLPYNWHEYTDGKWSGAEDGWNCVILTPSYDNSGNVQPLGGTDNPVSFLDAPYNDKLGAVYERFHVNDVRRKPGNFKAEADGTYTGMFLKGPMKASFGRGLPLKADADRDGQDLVYVDQVGTFLNLGKNLEVVMSPRWGETNSGVRLVKYPIFPLEAGVHFLEIDDVEFRLADVVYMLAECKLRAGDANGAKALVNSVRKRYFSAVDWATAENDTGVAAGIDQDWMLDQWGQEFLNEGRRRRTDLRRFDKFTQGQWWFFGRATDDDRQYPAKRERKYEWFPLPESALSVNKGLVQNPNY